MNEYNIVNISDNNYEIKGIRLANGKTCVFYKQKNSLINSVAITNGNSIFVNKGDVVLYLRGEMNVRDVKIFLMAFFNELMKIGVDVRLISVKVDMENDLEREQMMGILKEFGVSVEKTKNDNLVSNMNYDAVAAGKSKEIIKEDNGITKKFVVNDNKVYEDNGNLSLAEEKKILLGEWLSDPVMREKISTLSEMELDNLLMENVALSKNEYYMESANDTMKDYNDKEAIAKSVAYKNDGRYNAELGIMEEDVRSRDQYSVVEENNDRYNVVSPTVNNSVISGSNNGGDVVLGTVSANGASDNYMVNLELDEEQQRDVMDVVYYLDEESFKIYDAMGNEIGVLGSDSIYSVDLENNCLKKDGQVIGSLDDYRRMPVSVKDKNKPKVRTLMKDDNRAAYVSMPVILLVLSMLFIIGAIVLYVMS